MLPLNELTKSQTDRLGDRLRKGNISEADLRLLNTYRLSFVEPYKAVVREIQDILKQEPTGRVPKTPSSIVDKLRREHVRLSQMQDIAGCRIIVQDLSSQDDLVERLKDLFDRITIDDRRQHPSHGYRAVHVIVNHSGKLIEIQVRTKFQHSWAYVSEKLSDVVDRSIKYGGGQGELISLLMVASEITMHLELAIKANDIDGVIANSGRLRDAFEQLSVVIPSAKGLEDDISN